MRAEKYGGIGDWDMIFTVWVKEVGAVESAARNQLARRCVTQDYWKDGLRQTGIELLRCSFTEARRALMNAAGPCDASYIRHSSPYEFQ